MFKAGGTTDEIAIHFGVTRRTIQRIVKEPPVSDADDAEARRGRGVGRPGVDEALRLRLRELLAEDREAPPLEYLRLLREQGVRLGESTFYRVYRIEREKLPAELMVRFEGVAGEFAQFDFGQSDVRLLDGRKERIHFAAYRLKYSRWVWVVIVSDERVESLVRALLLCFEHAGGVPLRVVFDNPKTVVIGRENGRPVWNQTLAQVAIDYGFVIELCTPRSPEQKGAVENLVGWVKKSFFRARRFADVAHDLPRQLLEWLTVSNDERPSRATKEIPAKRMAAERARIKPLTVAPPHYGMRIAVHDGPTAL
jgi:transposase